MTSSDDQPQKPDAQVREFEINLGSMTLMKVIEKSAYDLEVQKRNEAVVLCSRMEAERDAIQKRCEELADENKCLQFNLEQKAGEIGRAEHRGNTVNYIYDKCDLYKRQLGEVVNELAAANDSAKRLERLLFEEKVNLQTANARIKELEALDSQHIDELSEALKQYTAREQALVEALDKIVALPTTGPETKIAREALKKHRGVSDGCKHVGQPKER